MGTSEWLGIIGIVLSVVSIIVGLCAHSKLNKFSARDIKNSTIAQGENVTIINNGTDAYAIVKIAKDVTQEEIKKLAERLESIKEEVQLVWEEFPERIPEEDIDKIVEEKANGQA